MSLREKKRNLVDEFFVSSIKYSVSRSPTPRYTLYSFSLTLCLPVSGRRLIRHSLCTRINQAVFFGARNVIIISNWSLEVEGCLANICERSPGVRAPIEKSPLPSVIPQIYRFNFEGPAVVVHVNTINPLK